MNQPLPLFRLQAQQHRDSQRLRGALILSQPLSQWLFTVFLTGLVMIAATFLVRHDYARKQSVTGTLVPDRGLIELRAPAAGSIARMHVAADAVVEAGEPLFTVRFDHTLAGEAALTERLLDELRVQETALQQQMRELERLVANERRLLNVKANALARAETLRGRGMLAAADYEAVYAQLLQQQGAVGRLVLQQGDMRAQAAELQKQQLRMTAEQDTIVAAPTRGRVAMVLRQPGMSVVAQEPVMMLLPDGALLQAELWLPSSASGFVARGQGVNLRYEAFPYQKFGVQHARIDAIAESAVQVQQNAPPLFRALATLDAQHIVAFGSPRPLRPGMALSADIVVDRRSLFEWLLEPLFSISGRAGRGEETATDATSISGTGSVVE
ncbi:MAG TPA: HlyD family efflux transporter periplasmic adaptor subunit [Pseudomonadales bacterium]